jgi:hypothetical protein
MSIETTARNASLTDLVGMLKREQDLKLDAVVPATAITSVGGNLVVEGMSAFGDTLAFRPTEICDGDLADKLSIPVKYLRRMRNERPDLFDANVNGWLRGSQVDFAQSMRDGAVTKTYPADLRSFTLRTFIEPGEAFGIARSLQSDRYAVIDNLDVLMGAMQGINSTGLPVTVHSADLSERRMAVRFHCEAVSTVADELLRGYRSPYSHLTGDQCPTVFAGFTLSNSETGGGAFTIVPEVVVEICSNGMRMTKDIFRKIHLGGKQDEGIVRYSEETRRKQVELVTLEARDTVAMFLDQDYLLDAVRHLTEKAGKPVTDAVKSVELVAKACGYTEDEQTSILTAFIAGGQPTAGGIMQAITVVAQEVADPDRAWELSNGAVDAMAVVV